MRRSLFLSTIVLAALGLAAIASVPEAQAAYCSTHVKSKNSNTPLKVTFVNKSGAFRGVMWADFNGKLVPYANLQPGQSYTVNTFATHPWIFTDGPGNCVEMWVARAGVSKFNITAKASGSGGD
jgi:von Hippel-Lindau disease tumor suppressor protein